MKKTLSVLVALMLCSIPAFAYDSWSFRGDVDKDDVTLLYGMMGTDFAYLNGNANAHAYYTDRSFQSSGYVSAQTPNKRISVSWDHKGNNYGVTLVSDDEKQMVFTAKAKVVWSYYNVEYQVPITVTYNKVTDTLNVKGETFLFNVDGIDLLE